MKSYKGNLQGGVFFSTEWVLQTALLPAVHILRNPLTYFLSKCKIRILTDASISCLTLRCDLNHDEKISPWQKFTSYAPFNDIRSILLKIFLYFKKI